MLHSFIPINSSYFFFFFLKQALNSSWDAHLHTASAPPDWLLKANRNIVSVSLPHIPCRNMAKSCSFSLRPNQKYELVLIFPLPPFKNMCLIIISFLLFPCNLTEHLQSQPVALLLQFSPPTGFLPISSTEMFLDKVWWPLFHQSSNPVFYLHFPWLANCVWYSQTRFSSWDLICPCLLWFVVFWYFSTEFLKHKVVQRGKTGRHSCEKKSQLQPKL